MNWKIIGSLCVVLSLLLVVGCVQGNGAVAGQAIGTLFDNVDLYLISDVPDENPEMRIVFGDEGSSHKTWQKELPRGVFRDLLEKSERGKPTSLYIEDISKSEYVGLNGPIFPHIVEGYQNRFEAPEAIFYAAAPVVRGVGDSRRTVGAIGLKVHGWAKKGPNSVVYTGGEQAPEAKRIEVDQAVEGLVLTIANQVARIAAQEPKKNLKELMPIVAASSQSLESQQRSTAIVPVGADRYHADSHTIKLRRSTANGAVVRLGLEIIKDPFRLFSSNSNKAKTIVNDMFKVFAAAWNPVVKEALDTETFRVFVDRRYWQNAARLVAVRALSGTKELCGFATLVREVVGVKKIIRLAGTVLDPSLQGMRLSVKLNRAMLYELWREGRKHPMLVCTYTGSPLVFGSLTGGLGSVYPDPHQPQKEPTAEQVAIFKELAHRHFPDAEIDEQHFIVRGGLKALGLGYDQTKMQLHHDPVVNDFFDKYVDSGDGDLVFPIGLLTRRVLRRETIKDILFRISRLRNRAIDWVMRRTLI